MLIRSSLFGVYRSLEKDDMATTSLIPEDLPLQPYLTATKTTGNVDCLCNAMSLALVGEETEKSSLFAHSSGTSTGHRLLHSPPSTYLIFFC